MPAKFKAHALPASAIPKRLRPELLLNFKRDTRTTVSREAVHQLARQEGVSETQLIHRALAEFRDRTLRRVTQAAAKLSVPSRDQQASAGLAAASAPIPVHAATPSPAPGDVVVVVTSRPRSLREAALQGRKQGHVDASLREFLDEFYVTTDPATRTRMLADEPPLIEDARSNAYLGAIAEHLALRNRLPVPTWAGKPARFLSRPFFPGGLESLKATLLKESPAAFRRRLIFVDADPLYRPRRDTAGAEIGASA